MPLSIAQAGGLHEPRARGDTDADDHELGLDRRAVLGDDALHRALALEALHRRLRQELDAVGAMQIEVDPSDLGPEHPLQRQRGHLDHRHLAALLAGRGRDLRADPARADDDQSLAAVDPLADSLRIAEGAQVVDAVQLCAGHVEPPRHRSGRDQEAVVAKAPVALEEELVQAELDARHTGRGQQLDVVARVEALVVDVRASRGLAPQVVLGERRAFVGALWLVADQHQAPVKSLLAEGLGRLRAGQAGADDYKCFASGRHLFLSRLAMRRTTWPFIRERRPGRRSYPGACA